MKKILLFACLFILFGCDQEDLGDCNIASKSDSKLLIRTEENVKDIINVLLPQIEPSKSRQTNTCIRKITTICGRSNRRASSDTLYYAVDLQDGGFVLVSASLNIPPILGYTEIGSFGDSESLRNENFQYFLENAENYIESSMETYAYSPISIIIPSFEYDTLTVYLKNEPKVTVNWNQMWPENQYCPNKIAGCGPVAFAQIMSFLKSPSEISLSYPGKDVGSINLNWNNIAKHTISTNEMFPSAEFLQNHYGNCPSSENEHANLGRLVREIGQQVSARYFENQTSTNIDSMLAFARRLYPTKQIIFRDTYASLYDDLNNKTTVAYIRGVDIGVGGHAWVADGTMQIKTYVNYYEKGTLKWSKDIHVDNYIHFNWGNGGNCNGYFLEGVFDTSKGTDFTGPLLTRGNFENLVKYFTISK